MSRTAASPSLHTWHQLLALLRWELWGAEPASAQLPQTDAEWQAVRSMAQGQTVDGVVFDALCRLPRERRPGLELWLHWLGSAQRLERRNAAMNTALGHLLPLLTPRLPHRPILLKGQGVARRYPHPEHRRCGDIDLYLGVEGTARLEAFAAEVGLKRGTTGEKHQEYTFEEQVVEAHHGTSDFMGTLLRTWTRIERRGLSEAPEEITLAHCDVPVLVPSATFDALYLFVHAYHHLLPVGVGLRQLCDWALQLHYEAARIDRHRLLQELDELNLRAAYGAFGYVLVHVLGLPAEHFPLDVEPYREGGEWLADDIRTGGNFGKLRVTAADHAPTVKARVRRVVTLWQRSRTMGRYFGPTASRYLWQRLWHIFRNS